MAFGDTGLNELVQGLPIDPAKYSWLSARETLSHGGKGAVLWAGRAVERAQAGERAGWRASAYVSGLRLMSGVRL